MGANNKNWKKQLHLKERKHSYRNTLRWIKNKKIGEWCISDSNCESERCADKKCAEKLGRCGKCDNDNHCSSNKCLSNGYCWEENPYTYPRFQPTSNKDNLKEYLTDSTRKEKLCDEMEGMVVLEGGKIIG